MATSLSSPQATAARRIPAQGGFQIDGHRLHWEMHGTAPSPAVVLLHHGLGSTASWRKQVPALTAEGWRVLAFDRWGYGQSDARPAFAWDFLRQDAAEALALLDTLALERVSLIGHSDGGSIALLMAAEHPERVARLVTVAAHIYLEPVTGGGVASIIAAAGQSPLREALAREHGDKAPSLVSAWTARWLDPSMRSLSLTDELSHIVCPTLVIQGELDEHATRQHAIDIARGIPGAELWLVPGGHHMLPQEQPVEFNRRMLTFLGAPSKAEVGPSG
jgi:pimeloyl-ACP methyl ester carboxylesterase